MATDKPRFSITVDKELLEQIEDYRFGNRIGKRSDAIVNLIKYGLTFYKIMFENKQKINPNNPSFNEEFSEYLRTGKSNLL